MLNGINIVKSILKTLLSSPYLDTFWICHQRSIRLLPVVQIRVSTSGIKGFFSVVVRSVVVGPRARLISVGQPRGFTIVGPRVSPRNHMQSGSFANGPVRQNIHKQNKTSKNKIQKNWVFLVLTFNLRLGFLS